MYATRIIERVRVSPPSCADGALLYIFLHNICDRICENQPHCKKCTLQIWVFEHGHVILDPNISYYTTIHLGPLATSW